MAEEAHNQRNAQDEEARADRADRNAFLNTQMSIELEKLRGEIKTLMVLIEVHRSSHDAEHKFNKEAIEKASETQDRRFASVNEFRQTLTDQATTFARQETVDAKFTSLQARVETLTAANQERVDVLNRATTDKMNTLGTTLGDKIIVLEKQGAQLSGGRSGSADTFRYIVMAVGFLVTLLTLVGIILALKP